MVLHSQKMCQGLYLDYWSGPVQKLMLLDLNLEDILSVMYDERRGLV